MLNRAETLVQRLMLRCQLLMLRHRCIVGQDIPIIHYILIAARNGGICLMQVC